MASSAQVNLLDQLEGPQCYFAEDLEMTFPCPNTIASVAFTVVFGMLTVAHVFGALYYKKRYCWILVVAAAMETAALGTRASIMPSEVSGHKLIAFWVLLGVAPWYLTIFTELAALRMFYYWLPDKKMWNVRVRTWYKSVAYFSVFNFFILPIALMHFRGFIKLAIIPLQLSVIVLAGGMLGTFVVRANKNAEERPKPFQPTFSAISIALVLITINTVVSLVSMFTWHPWFNTILGAINIEINTDFDAGAMALILAIFVFFHPGRTMPGPASVFPPLHVTKGSRGWHSCGRRHRTVVDPDFVTEVQGRRGEERGFDGIMGVKLTDSRASTIGAGEAA